MGYLRRLLGVWEATPNVAVLLETCELSMWMCWLQRAGRLWNRLTPASPGSLLHTAFSVSCQSQWKHRPTCPWHGTHGHRSSQRPGPVAHGVTLVGRGDWEEGAGALV
jgi:hypothetical protein